MNANSSRINKFLFNILEKFFLDVFFAKRCLSCGEDNIMDWVCADCRDIILSEINVCSFKLEEGVVCDYFFSFKEGPLRELMHNLKYGGIWDLGTVIASLLSQTKTAREVFLDAIVVPVPISKKRLSQRGYNQVEMIAQGLAKYYDIKVNCNLLHRFGASSSQVGKSREERKVALGNQFRVVNGALESVETNKKIILMDDVVVTGSTLLSCRKAFIDAGYNNVRLLAVAREL